MNIKHGATDQSITFVLVDADGVEATGLTITDLDIVYARDRAAAVKADLTALSAVTDAHSDNKAIEIDATNAPGLYRVDFPDAAFASGVDRVQLIINGAAIKPAVIEVELVAKLVSDLNDAAAAPSAADIKTALEAAGSHLTLVKAKTDTLPESPAAVGSAMTLTSGERTSIATAVWAATTRTLSSFGTLIASIWGYETRALTDKAGFSLTTAPPTAAAIRGEMDSNSTQLAAIKAKTDGLDFSGSGSMLKSESTNMRGTDGANTIAPNNALIENINEGVGLIYAAAVVLVKLGRADMRLNTTTTPWQEEIYESGTDTLIFAKKLYTVDLAPVTSMAAYAAYKQENAL